MNRENLAQFFRKYFYIMYGFFNKRNHSLFLFNLLVTVIIGLLVISLNYTHYPASGIKDSIKILSHWVLVNSACFVVFSLISVNKYAFSALFPPIVITSAIGVFFVYQFDISMNEALFDSLLNTNIYEVLDLVSLPLLGYLLLIFIITAILVWVRYKIKGKQNYVVLACAMIACFLLSFYINSVRHNTILQRIPFSYYLSYKKYVEGLKELSVVRKGLTESLSCGNDSLTVVIVLGEALRADHLQLNGYERVTMPLMEKVDVVSLPNIYTKWTHTDNSLPHILTRADSVNNVPSYEEKSFIHMFKKCGFYTSWLGNQIPGVSYKYFINECDTVFINKPQFSVYSAVKKLDTDLFPRYASLIKKDMPKQLMLLHQIGSHWWYNSHYSDDFAVFQPELEGKHFSERYKKEYINSYDNTIVFTDYFLSKVIKKLERRNALFLYIADHGESMGEEGNWLHANDAIAEKNPACFVWLSEQYKNKYPSVYQNLLRNKNKHYNTDVIFHSVLQAAGISSPYFVPELSIFSAPAE